MSNPNSTIQEGENLIYDAVKDLTKDELERRVRKNAAAKDFHLTSEHLGVIQLLIEHYKRDCKAQDCFAAHEQMRFSRTPTRPKAEASISICCLMPYLMGEACSCLFMSSPVCLH